MTNAGQEGTRIDTKISGISNSKVKVINITNYHPASGQDLRREQHANITQEAEPAKGTAKAVQEKNLRRRHR